MLPQISRRCARGVDGSLSQCLCLRPIQCTRTGHFTFYRTITGRSISRDVDLATAAPRLLADPIDEARRQSHRPPAHAGERRNHDEAAVVAYGIDSARCDPL